MRVFVFGTRGFPDIQGGVEKHCEKLYPHMQKDVDLTVCRRAPFVNRNGDYDNIVFKDIPVTQKRGFEAAIHSLKASLYAIKVKPDIVHIHNIGPALYAPLLKLFGLKTILTYHSPNYEHDKWNIIEKSILKFSEHLALKYSDRIIFVNKNQLGKYPQKIQSKSIYIPNGVDEPMDINSTTYLDDFGLEPNKYILSVGRITPEKGFDTLIKAFNNAETKDYKLVIAGGVEFEDKYLNEIKDLAKNNNVVFTGYVYGEKLAQLYKNASLYVLASRNEGFPLVMLEAMSYNLNIIASDIPATHIDEMDENNFFQCDNVEQLAEKITNYLSTDKQPVSYDLSKYNWENIAQQVVEQYKILTNKK